MSATLDYFNTTYGDAAIIAYDGDCPMCKRYVRWVRLKQLAKQLHMVNLRDLPTDVLSAISNEYNLDDGMLFVMDGNVYYGQDAVHRLALLSSGSSLFNRVNRSIFKHELLSKAIYPWLVRGRIVLLRLLGRKMINE
ncbi:MAG: DUF393 domain-containing protein [Alphaproteobacteria bacterium]|nr:DUF393 domain-containing protein [Alphaproteobacteria bacterium]